MADKDIGSLTAVDLPLGGTELLHIVDADGNSRKIALSDLKTFINTDPTVVPSSVPYRGAQVRRTSDATGLTFPYFTVWQAATRDTDSIWSAGAPTRLTVPTGVTKVQLSASIGFENVAEAGSLLVQFAKNGSTTFDGNGTDINREDATGFTSNVASVSSAVLDVVAGDYFEVRINKSGMASVDQVLATSWTWFEMQIIEATV